jgi:hypothetical protein
MFAAKDNNAANQFVVDVYTLQYDTGNIGTRKKSAISL